MSKIKKLKHGNYVTRKNRILVDKIKLQTKVELDKIVHWEIYNGSKEKENYLKRTVIKELLNEYNKENE